MGRKLNGKWNPWTKEDLKKSADMCAQGFFVDEIAKELKRTPKSVSSSFDRRKISYKSKGHHTHEKSVMRRLRDSNGMPEGTWYGD